MHKPSNYDPEVKYPVLASVYGGPETNGASESFALPNALTEYGFLVVTLDARSAKGRGKAILDSIYLKLGQTEIDDFAAAIRSLRDRKDVDSSRVGIFGTSYGGSTSLLCLLRYPDVFQAACASSAVTDFRHYDTIYAERYLRTPAENKAGYDGYSSMLKAGNLKGRLMIYYGTADDNVHPSNSLQLIKALNAAGKSYRGSGRPRPRPHLAPPRPDDGVLPRRPRDRQALNDEPGPTTRIGASSSGLVRVRVRVRPASACRRGRWSSSSCRRSARDADELPTRGVGDPGGGVADDHQGVVLGGVDRPRRGEGDAVGGRVVDGGGEGDRPVARRQGPGGAAQGVEAVVRPGGGGAAVIGSLKVTTSWAFDRDPTTLRHRRAVRWWRVVGCAVEKTGVVAEFPVAITPA